MYQAYLVSRELKIPFSKIKILLKNIDLTPLDGISEEELSLLKEFKKINYKNFLNVGELNSNKLFLKKKKIKKRKYINPLNPNSYDYKNIRIINTPFGGKVK